MIRLLKFRRSQHDMKRLYNRISGFYEKIENSLGPKIDTVVNHKISGISGCAGASALEYCCGSGLLTLKLAPHFKSVTAKDQSAKMLERAESRAHDAQISNTSFIEGDILDIVELPESYDYVFVSFALHLFPIDKEIEILDKLFIIAKKAVFIIDHNRKWTLPVAFVEWLEGSHYDKFIKTDFAGIAHRIGCTSYKEEEIEECMVLSFSH